MAKVLFTALPVEMEMKVEAFWDEMTESEGSIRAYPSVGECYKVENSKIVGSRKLIDAIREQVSDKWAAKKLVVAADDVIKTLEAEYEHIRKNVDLDASLQTAETLKEYGNTHYNAGRYRVAEKIYERIFGILDALIYLDLTKAQKEKTRALLAKIWFNRGCCAWKRNDLLAAIFFLDQCLKIDSKYIKAARLYEHIARQI